jgi:hypothetical protein
MKRLTDSGEWAIFVAQLAEVKKQLHVELLIPLTNDEAALRLSRVQGKLEMMEFIFDFPGECMRDAAELISAFQLQQETSDG